MNQFQRHYCPICWQYVLRTTSGNVRRHMDSLNRDTCPYSSEPWEATIQGPRKPKHYVRRAA